MICSQETICALSTPPGVGGIGVIRISGPSTFDIVDRITRRKSTESCSMWRGHTLHRADIIDADGRIIDNVLLSIFHSPKSYTGEDVVEISAHGGPVPLREILARAISNGARIANPGEFTLRAFLNGKIDLAQAEAVGDIIASRTKESHRLAQNQATGAYSQHILAIRDVVLGVLALVEASIDFPEDVGELDLLRCDREIVRAASLISNLLKTASRGILLREGARLVLVGRPNVGKSSLMNALLRMSRSLVTEIAGTTRDTVEESFSINGIPICAIDTAGIRDTEEQIEKLGVERTRDAIKRADLLLVVVDSTDGITREDEDILTNVRAYPHLLVWNKWDTKPPESPVPSAGVHVSALTGDNLDELETAIISHLSGDITVNSDLETAVVSHVRHRHALQSANVLLAECRSTIAMRMSSDLISGDLRGALVSLGEITGETVVEDVISEIFSRFCIGK